jgi:Asp-tRNA(Asn)/Glu-tRNA(Gln) amidotransferase A subunit family amidase
MTDAHTDLPETPSERLPARDYETQDHRIDRRGFLARMGALGAAGVAAAALPAVTAKPASATSWSSPYVPVRPEALKDPTECTVAEAATLIASRKLKPSTLTEAYLARIAKFDGDYWQAYMTVLADASRARAKLLDKARIVSPIHGVSIPVKDNFYTKGVLTTAQSLIFADFVPDVDSTAVARIQKAGGIVLGKLQMGPLAGGRPRDPATGVSTTRNAWSPNDPGPSPSGSSGGSGCATGARLATCTLGTQTGGSITGPGTANGLTALKPTHGRCSVFGVIPLTITRDHIGPLARDAKDAAIVTEVLAGPAKEDPRTIGLPPVPDLVAAATPVVRWNKVVPRWRLKVGITAGFADGTTPAALARQAMLATLANIGYDVVDVDLPDEYETLSGGAFNVSSSERAEMDFAVLKEDVRLFADRLTGWTGALMLGGAEVAKGLRCRMRAIELAFTELFSQCDLIFSSTGFDAIGFPLCTLPIGFAPNAQGIVLPIATTLGGPAFGEEKILSVIAAYQAVTDFHLKRPPDPIVGLAAASDPRTERIRLTAKDAKREQAEALA